MDNYYTVILNVALGVMIFCAASLFVYMIGYLTYELVMFFKERKRKKLEKKIKDGKELKQ